MNEIAQERYPMLVEFERMVNRLLLFDMAHDGILYNEERAKQGPCTCFTLPSGKPYCWDEGIIGALSQDQIGRFCPPEKRTPREGGRIPQRVEKFISASESCEIGKTFAGAKVTDLQSRIRCMSEALRTQGIEV